MVYFIGGMVEFANFSNFHEEGWMQDNIEAGKGLHNVWGFYLNARILNSIVLIHAAIGFLALDAIDPKWHILPMRMLPSYTTIFLPIGLVKNIQNPSKYLSFLYSIFSRKCTEGNF